MTCGNDDLLMCLPLRNNIFVLTWRKTGKSLYKHTPSFTAETETYQRIIYEREVRPLYKGNKASQIYDYRMQQERRNTSLRGIS